MQTEDPAVNYLLGELTKSNLQVKALEEEVAYLKEFHNSRLKTECDKLSSEISHLNKDIKLLEARNFTLKKLNKVLMDKMFNYVNIITTLMLKLEGNAVTSRLQELRSKSPNLQPIPTEIKAINTQLQSDFLELEEIKYDLPTFEDLPTIDVHA